MKNKYVRPLTRFGLNKMMEKGLLHFISIENYDYSVLKEDLN
jgi:hypothetical protein